ncbi:MAG: GNAT family N-acetyltransferase [Alphaproteobacteria bacterium]|nr:GNAT family N-acetyltransferase [Alphaproteobacteria bacterium]
MTSDPALRHVETSADALIDLRWAVLRAGRPRETARLSGDELPSTRHFASVAANGSVLACATVMVAPWPEAAGPLPAPVPALRLRGMAVAAGLQGTGVGSALLHHVHDAVAAPMWCDARLRAVPFYVRSGWRITSEVYEVPEVGPHRRMVWQP